MVKFLVFFLLVGTLSCCYGNAGVQEVIYPDVAAIEKEVMRYIKQGLTNYTGTEKDKFKLQANGRLGRTKHALVWKGLYSDGAKLVNHPVAIKIIHDSASMEKEFMVFENLNAVKNPKIENSGIPQIYYYGWFLNYDAIVMTLFEGSVDDRYEIEQKAGKKFTDTTILSIFMQAVEGLKYLSGFGIVHNDIKPENMFLRDNKLFIGDFDQATLAGGQTDGHSAKFASKNFYLEKPRTAMDDLESLVYSMWYIADVPMVREAGNVITEGYLLSQCDESKQIARMKEKCSHLSNQKVQDVFNYIAVDQVLSGKPNPDYDLIISKLNATLNAIKKGAVRFEWLKK